MDDIIEIWKPIKGYEDRYVVSNLGRVKRLERITCQNIYLEEKLLQNQNNGNGYFKVHLFKNGRTKDKYIHRLVAEAFISNPENKKEVNHKDGDKANNFVENLEWVTPSENQKHACKIGLHLPFEIKFGKDHPRARKIIQYDLEGNFIKIYDSISDACRDSSMNNHSRIVSCCKNKSYSHNNFQWKYYIDNYSLQIGVCKSYKPIIQYSLDNIFIREFTSLQEVFESTNISKNNILNCCSGKSKTSSGYIWKYKY